MQDYILFMYLFTYLVHFVFECIVSNQLYTKSLGNADISQRMNCLLPNGGQKSSLISFVDVGPSQWTYQPHWWRMWDIVSVNELWDIHIFQDWLVVCVRTQKNEVGSLSIFGQKQLLCIKPYFTLFIFLDYVTMPCSKRDLINHITSIFILQINRII